MKNLDFQWITDEFMLYCRATQNSGTPRISAVFRFRRAADYPLTHLVIFASNDII